MVQVKNLYCVVCHKTVYHKLLEQNPEYDTYICVCGKTLLWKHEVIKVPGTEKKGDEK